MNAGTLRADGPEFLFAFESLFEAINRLTFVQCCVANQNYFNNNVNICLSALSFLSLFKCYKFQKTVVR